MSFKLSKDERSRREEIVAALREAADKITEAVDAYKEALVAPTAAVEAAVAAYNAALAEASEFAQEVSGRIGDDIDEKSEKWQESEKGEAAGAWRDAWDELSLDDIEIEFPDEIEFDTPEHADELENAPDSADAA